MSKELTTKMTHNTIPLNSYLEHIKTYSTFLTNTINNCLTNQVPFTQDTIHIINNTIHRLSTITTKTIQKEPPNDP